MAVDKFEVGKWYIFVGKKDDLFPEIIDIADGKPRKCLSAKKEIVWNTYDELYSADFSRMKNKKSKHGYMWQWDIKDFVEVKRPKNKYRKFTEEDVGKTFTVRMWRDIADEFEPLQNGYISLKEYDFIMSNKHIKYCRSRIKLSKIGDKYMYDNLEWIPQLFEECIIDDNGSREDKCLIFTPIKDETGKAEVKAPSQPKPKNKYRSFTKDDIGKTFTVRQWDDMASEFGVNFQGDIDSIFFVRNMKEFCGAKVKIVTITNHNDSAIIYNSRYRFSHQAFEECIIKEPKAGDTVTVKSEGLMVNKEFLDTGKIDWMLGNPLGVTDIEKMSKTGEVEFKIKGQLSEKDKEAIKEGIKKRSSIYFSTPSISQPNWIESDWTTGVTKWYEKFKNSESRVTPRYEWHTDLGASKEFVESLNQQWGGPYFKIEGHDLSHFDKQDKTKFNTNLIKTEKLNFRMDK